jgi:CRP-like cAMP-binding protein
MIKHSFSNPVSFTYVNAPGRTVAHGSGMTVRSFTSWTASEAPDPFETEPRLTSATVRLWNAFAPLDPELRRWGLAVGSVRPCQAGDACLGAEEVAVVVSGCLSLDAPGSDLTADLLGPGDVLAAGGPRTASGRWITDGELYCVDMEAWIESVGAEGVAHLLAAVERRRMGLERRILCASTHRATARVADLSGARDRPLPGTSWRDAGAAPDDGERLLSGARDRRRLTHAARPNPHRRRSASGAGGLRMPGGLAATARGLVRQRLNLGPQTSVSRAEGRGRAWSAASRSARRTTASGVGPRMRAVMADPDKPLRTARSIRMQDSGRSEPGPGPDQTAAPASAREPGTGAGDAAQTPSESQRRAVRPREARPSRSR